MCARSARTPPCRPASCPSAARRVLDHEVRARRLLQVGRGDGGRVHGAHEPTRRRPAVVAVQDRLADQLLPLILRLERRDVLEDLPARRRLGVADAVGLCVTCQSSPRPSDT